LISSESVAVQYLRLPHVERGMAVGLFGGSFNPPHEGHLLVAQTALKRLELDQVWWVVTPGNPLKASRKQAPLAERIAGCEALARDPRMKVTAFEAGRGFRFTADTLAWLRARNPGVHFVWMMGADSLRDFHRWQRWQRIAGTFPIAVFDRPGATLSFLSSRAAQALRFAMVDEEDAAALARMAPPAWSFIRGPRSSLSSTEIRRKRGIVG
jgi:nicotinate-nucleotide adenylyltransferase